MRLSCRNAMFFSFVICHILSIFILSPAQSNFVKNKCCHLSHVIFIFFTKESLPDRYRVTLVSNRSFTFQNWSISNEIFANIKSLLSIGFQIFSYHRSLWQIMSMMPKTKIISPSPPDPPPPPPVSLIRPTTCLGAKFNPNFTESDENIDFMRTLIQRHIRFMPPEETRTALFISHYNKSSTVFQVGPT